MAVEDHDLGNLNRQVSRIVKPVPFKGIDAFFDISGLLSRPDLFQLAIDHMCKEIATRNPTVICALDARGFLLGAPISLQLRLPLLMVRKGGKLPGECISTSFNKEYESGDVFEMQAGSITPDDSVVVVDDVIATGGSMLGAYTLIRQMGVTNIMGACMMDLCLPGSREFLDSHGMTVWSLLDVTTWEQ
jgi:adenine phosphoribosyltransferase